MMFVISVNVADCHTFIFSEELNPQLVTTDLSGTKVHGWKKSQMDFQTFSIMLKFVCIYRETTAAQKSKTSINIH